MIPKSLELKFEENVCDPKPDKNLTTNMASEDTLPWKCYDCNMTFNSGDQLRKHKHKFCVGGSLGDPNLLLLRKGFRDDAPPEPKAPPDLVSK